MVTENNPPVTSPKYSDGLAAAADDPWIGVHVLTEFVFCPRAGLIAGDSGSEDSGDDYWLRPNLDFQPCYELHQIEERLQRQLNALWRTCAVLAFLLGGAGLAFLSGHFGWMIPPGLLLLLLSGRTRRQFEAVRQSWILRREALAPQGVEPDPEHDNPQSVIWWQLLQAGFQSVAYPLPLRDESSRLVGRPWRILRKGDWRIPVFRTWPQRETSEGRLYPQHFVRMAAYQYLLEFCEGAEAPYGVILFGDSFSGTTVPLRPEHRWQLQEALSKSRKISRQFEEVPHTVPPPPPPKWCVGCPFGVPQNYRPGTSDTRRQGTLLNPMAAVASDRQMYHSLCGDWFRWWPPHELAIQLKLPIASLEKSTPAAQGSL